MEQRIIEQKFDGNDLIAAWIQQQGYSVTTDNVYRHALKLKAEPPSIREVRAGLKKAGVIPHCDNDDLQRLLIKLGALRLEERVLMAQIADLSMPG